MPLPKYHELYKPILDLLRNGEEYKKKDIRSKIATAMNLSDEDLSALLPSGKQTVFYNRVGWAITYLKKADLLISLSKGTVKITDEGKKLIESGVNITDRFLIEKYPSFANFKLGAALVVPSNPDVNPDVTPEEKIDSVYKEIKEKLADDLIDKIMGCSFYFFEHLVVDLMEAMGYGEGFVTKASHDNGLDGVINQDKLGFNKICVQAKRFQPDSTIHKPEIQKFAGAMMGPPKIESGLFITTARFSQGASNYAKDLNIVLIDGQKLADLMIEYGLGVSLQKSYNIKRIDNDYFDEEN